MANDHPSTSSVQKRAEAVLREQASRVLNVSFSNTMPRELHGFNLDAYADGDIPICLEIFAHIGRSKAGQKRKLSRDMTKLLLAERLLERQCRKVIVVCDEETKTHLNNGWDGEFAKAFEIEILVVNIDVSVRQEIQCAQERQFR